MLGAATARGRAPAPGVGGCGSLGRGAAEGWGAAEPLPGRAPSLLWACGRPQQPEQRARARAGGAWRGGGGVSLYSAAGREGGRRRRGTPPAAAAAWRRARDLRQAGLKASSKAGASWRRARASTTD